MTITDVAQQNIRSAKDRRTSPEIIRRSHAFCLVVAAGLLVIAVVFMSAFAADLRRVNNELIAENEYIRAEIDSLNIKIGDACSVSKIERIATEELGMVHPDSDNCVALGEERVKDTDLAATIKDEAYD